MITHNLQYTLTAKKFLPDEVFNGCTRELLHWINHHGMNLRQLKQFIENTEKKGDYDEDIELIVKKLINCKQCKNMVCASRDCRNTIHGEDDFCYQHQVLSKPLLPLQRDMIFRGNE